MNIDNKIFLEFNKNLTNRINRIEFYKIGEDSIRYDFFSAISKLYNLNTYDIVLESPLHKDTFIPNNDVKSKRKENPKMDLVIDTDDLNLNVEFALFRRNSIEKSGINKTQRTFKMLNDMIRLGLENNYTGRKSIFVCVADNKMLGHKLSCKLINKFPSKYIINNTLLKELNKYKTKGFDERFTVKFMKSKFDIEANIIFNKKIDSSEDIRIIVWEINNIVY